MPRGLEFVRQIAGKYPKFNLIATVRDPIKSGEAVKTAFEGANGSAGGRCEVVRLDADSEESIKEAAEEIGRLFPDGIDVLIVGALTGLWANCVVAPC